VNLKVLKSSKSRESHSASNKTKVLGILVSITGIREFGIKASANRRWRRGGAAAGASILQKKTTN
jgi:hypothetical protein